MAATQSKRKRSTRTTTRASPLRRRRQDEAADAVETAPASPPRGIFTDQVFYLTSKLAPKRRAALRKLIIEHNGKTVMQYAPGAIELVEHDKLQEGTPWVSADFVADSIAAGVMQSVLDYIARQVIPAESAAAEGARVQAIVEATEAVEEAAEAGSEATATPAETPTTTKTPRITRRRFSVAEDAAMLAFLKEQVPNYFLAPSVPERVCKSAEAKQITSHSGQSMHQRYRKQLVRLSRKQQEELAGSAALLAESEANAEEQAPAATAPSTAQDENDENATALARPAVESQTRASAHNVHTDTDADSENLAGNENEDQRPKKRRRSTLSAPPSPAGRAAARALMHVVREQRHSLPAAATQFRAQDMTVTEQNTVQSESLEQMTDAVETTESDHDVEAAPDPVNENQTQEQEHNQNQGQDENHAQVHDQEQLEQNKGGLGFVFRSFWERLVGERPQLAQKAPFFPTQTAMPSSPSNSDALPDAGMDVDSPGDDDGAQVADQSLSPRRNASSRLDSNTLVTSTLREVHPNSRTTSARRRPQAAEPLLVPTTEGLQPRFGRPAATAAISEDEAKALICQLQFCSSQDTNAVLSALYFASGCVGIAKSFLLGDSPRGMWNPHDDQVLLNFRNEFDGPVEHAHIVAGLEGGAFESFSIDRSGDEILDRLTFLV